MIITTGCSFNFRTWLVHWNIMVYDQFTTQSTIIVIYKKCSNCVIVILAQEMCIVKKYNTASNLWHVTKIFKYTFLYMKNIVKPVKTTKGNLKMWPLWAVALYIQVKIIYVSTFKLIVHPSVMNFPSFWLDSYLGIDHGSM
jgi:hypothetical protein